jgi:hypothetical protein
MLGGDLPGVLPVTLSAPNSQVHHVLRNYKDSKDSTVRARFTIQLAGLLEVFASNHGDCIGAFDVVTCIPSLRKRTAFEAVASKLSRYRDLYQPLLTIASAEESHVLSTKRFAAEPQAVNQRVLLLDDTFTTGASVFSATHSLRAAGATVNTVLVVGRYINPGYGPTAQLLDAIKTVQWSETDCTICRTTHS